MTDTEKKRTLVLTGASRGIGHATVKRFSAEGWRVLTCSRRPFDDRCPWPGGADDHADPPVRVRGHPDPRGTGGVDSR